MVGSAESWRTKLKKICGTGKGDFDSLPRPQKAQRAQEKGGQRPLPPPMNMSKGERLREVPRARDEARERGQHQCGAAEEFGFPGLCVDVQGGHGGVLSGKHTPPPLPRRRKS
ncbi:hypothetical protein B5X24_HaOG209893, partial [Helicoverpa armigera]